LNQRSKIILLWQILLSFALLSSAQPQKTNRVAIDTRILFIFDASQSMQGNWESGKKIDIARNLLIHMIDSLENIGHVQMALRVYGHQSVVPPQDCNDTRLEVSFKPGNAGKIRQTLRYLTPRGTTPIARSLKMAANDCPPTTGPIRNVIILITDGKEACDGDPCAISENLQKQGIILKPFIIGIGLDKDFKDTFQCVGKFLSVNHENNMKTTLDYVISQMLNETTVQLNIIDKNGNPSETNVPATFCDHISGKIVKQYIHTLTAQGIPDLIHLDPLRTYDLTVNTLPAVHLNNINITPGKNNIIGIKAPQGFIRVIAPHTNLYRNLQILVKHSNHTLNVQQINETGKYLTGNYDLKILTLPRMHIDSVVVDQNHTTTIEIPRPGLVTILKPATGYGSILMEKDRNLEMVTPLKLDKIRETFTLLPGEYHLIYRSKKNNHSANSIQKKFTITSGQSLQVRL